MSVRAVWRYVKHRIMEHPDTVVYDAQCLACEWRADPAEDAESVDRACMSHTACTDHKSFRRNRSSVAVVFRLE